MSSLDVDYYRQRASAEREMANDAGQANVAAIHAELARQYERSSTGPSYGLRCGLRFRQRVAPTIRGTSSLFANVTS